MKRGDVLKLSKEGLTPLVSIISFKDLGTEIFGVARYEINGFGFPVIAQATWRATKEGKLLEVKPTVKIGVR